MIKYLYFLPIFLFPLLLFGQAVDSTAIIVSPTPNKDVEKLVLDEFINKGKCVEVFNIKPIGKVESIGSFSNGRLAMGVESGIVFTTGELRDISGPNKGNSTSGNTSGASDAPYLSSSVRGAPFFDVVGIEFDFTPTSDFVSFNYVFASEEYCEYVDSEFNDAFGFYVSGPGIEGEGFNKSTNVAKVKDKNDAVTINNVNHLKNSTFFVSNLRPEGADECEIMNNIPKSLNRIEFDGFTRVMQSLFSVIPCETYHLRLVVGDVSDDVLDSAVFLEGKSFDTGAKATIRSVVEASNQDSLVYENCLEGSFVISRSKLSDRDKPLNVDVSILGTAANGVDFPTIPNQITLEPREPRRTIPMIIEQDELVEGQEYVEVILKTTTCDCEEFDTARMYIGDTKENLSILFEDEMVCSREPFQISPTIPDGVQPLIYEWNTGDTTSYVADEITNPKSYSVTVSDACGAMNSNSVDVQIQAVPSITLAGSFTWCEGRSPEVLAIDLPGQAPWSLEYTINSELAVLLTDIKENPYPFSFNQFGNYSFEGFNDKHCTGIVQGDIAVSDVSFQLDASIKPPSCLNGSDGEIELLFQGGIAPFSIAWDTLEATSSVLTDLSAGNYSVLATDQSGCLVEQFFLLPDAVPSSRCNIDLDKSLYIPNAFSPNGDGINDKFAVFPKLGIIQSVQFSIFDRWGNLLHESNLYAINDPPAYWDGGKTQVGVYVCLVEVTLSDGSKDYFGQDVTLIK